MARRIVRQKLTALSIVSVGIGWIIFLVVRGIAYSALPWCVTFGGVIVAGIALLCRKNKIQWGRDIAGRSDSILALDESFALTLIVISLSLAGCWPRLSRNLMHIVEKPVQTQFVDIEFSTGADQETKPEVPPDNLPKPAKKLVASAANVVQPPVVKPESPSVHTPLAVPAISHRKSAELHAEQGARSEKGEHPQPSEGSERLSHAQNSGYSKSPERAQHSKHSPDSQRDAQTALPPLLSTNNFPIKITQSPSVSSNAHANATPFLEEVPPPELMEVMDNDDDKNAATGVAGERSKGGAGTASPLSTYLKEVQKRIRHAWAPPPDKTRTAQILFRIKRTGKLVSVKLIASSGDSDADASAMHAITACSPFKALPGGFSSDYLDLLYTFNYRADALSEVSTAHPE